METTAKVLTNNERLTLKRREYPLLIKYMGSKSKIIDFVVDGINEVYNGGRVCDVFAGSSSLSGAIGHQTQMIVNDIQSYSSVLAGVYLHRLSTKAQKLSIENLVSEAGSTAEQITKSLPSSCIYPAICSLNDFVKIEEANRGLINQEFSHPYHLFLKNYSGTWWSAEQCIWIDALREVIDAKLEKDQISYTDHQILLVTLMHAMIYASQGTGHFAQYRDAKTQSSMKDINLYRQKRVKDLFLRKWQSLKEWNLSQPFLGDHEFMSVDYKDCLATLNRDTVYADPPYAFVHYSRFYHAFETFIKYDYPALQIQREQTVKGRYREDRHQSPFSIRTQVPNAFKNLFEGVRNTYSNLVLSYSNTGLYCLDELYFLAQKSFGTSYDLDVLTINHTHMTMGRSGDRNRDVEEALILARLKNSSN